MRAQIRRLRVVVAVAGSVGRGGWSRAGEGDPQPVRFWPALRAARLSPTQALWSL